MSKEIVPWKCETSKVKVFSRGTRLFTIDPATSAEKDVTDYTFERIPPKEIADAAIKVSEWMESQGKEYWELMGVCDRRFATKPKAL